jgi:ABC-type sugar transport system permease subunit
MLFRYIVSVTGPLSVLEKELGINPIDFLGKDPNAIKTILFYCVWTGLGMNIVLFSSAMGRIPKEIFESAALDGIGSFRELFSIVLPLSWGTISTLIILSAAQLFTVLGPIILLTNGQNGTQTIASLIFYQVKTGSENAYAYASAVGLIFTIIGLPIVLILKKVLDKINGHNEF